MAAFSSFVEEGGGAVPDSQAAPAAAPAPVAAEPVAVPAPATAAAPTPAAAIPVAAGSRVVASPKARALASSSGKDLSSIPGTGPNGRVLAADVAEWVQSAAVQPAAANASAGSAAPAAPVSNAGGYTDYPLSADAQAIANAALLSKRNVPHYYLTVEVTMDEVIALRKQLNKSLGEGNQLSVNDFIVKAAANAMKTVPSVNASWHGSFVRNYEKVDVNVFVGSGETLRTPLLKDVGGSGLSGISTAITNAVEDESSSNEIGSFSFINLGMYGLKSAAPVITEPQAGMLAVGAIEEKVVPNDASAVEAGGEIYKYANVMTATLSVDHRVVDGAVGAQWLAAFRGHVEKPITLLL